MIDGYVLDRKLKRRVKQNNAPPRDRSKEHEIDSEFLWKRKRSGRVRRADPLTTYSVGGIRKLSEYVADPDPDGDGYVNGWSDKVDNPRRVQRSSRRRSKNGKKRGRVVR
jgi:hypothetical protein